MTPLIPLTPPLAPMTLARALQAAASPLSIGGVLEMLQDAQHRARFADLVRRFLPQSARSILHSRKRLGEAVDEFVKAFTEEHFPISISYGGGLEELLNEAMPDAMGMCYHDYFENFQNWRLSWLGIILLVESPYADFGWDDGDLPEGMLDEEEGRDSPHDPHRISLLDQLVSETGGVDLARRIPIDGLDRGLLHRRVAGTPFQAAGLIWDILWQDSDYVWLNLDHDDAEEGDWAQETHLWERPDLESLAGEWRKCQRALEDMNAFMDWLEEDFVARFGQLLDVALDDSKDPKGPRPNMTLAEVFASERSDYDNSNGAAPEDQGGAQNTPADRGPA